MTWINIKKSVMKWLFYSNLKQKLLQYLKQRLNHFGHEQKDSTVFITKTKREPVENTIALQYGFEQFVI